MRFAIFASMFFLILLAGSVSALDIADYQVVYDIQADGKVQEKVTILFKEGSEESATFIKLLEGSDFIIQADGKDVGFTITPEGENIRVDFTIPQGTRELFLSFKTGRMVFGNGDVLQFFSNLQVPTGVEKLNVKTILPKGFVIFHDTFSPSNATRGTDGERIFLSWLMENPPQEIAFSVQYESVVKVDQFALPLVGIIAFVVIVVVFLYFRKKSSKAFLMTFFEDERKVILALMTEKVLYQNSLERKFGFSRAKMTRIMQKLERKGLIRRERAGRTNRIFWK